MSGYERILHYFPALSERQQDHIQQLHECYGMWNSRINLISRKDFKNFYTHHVLHALSLAKAISFRAGMKVLDIGTGGGIPGLPLAILFPDSHFTLIDSIGKKIKAVQDIVHRLALPNIRVQHIRAEAFSAPFDMAIGRSVTQLPIFVKWASAQEKNAAIAYLTGGDIEAEACSIGRPYRIVDIHTLFREPYFRTKKIVCFP